MEKFVADGTLGKLVKWLRILGYDTLFVRGNLGRERLRAASEEGRIVLTRWRRGSIGSLKAPERLVVRADRVEDQIDEILEALNLYPDAALTLSRCLRCNSPLEKIESESVAGLVPAYVQEVYDRFHRCPVCGGIYWPGSHRQRIDEVIRRRNLARRP
jgi:uncharacterized protein with PIN domain